MHQPEMFGEDRSVLVRSCMFWVSNSHPSRSASNGSTILRFQQLSQAVFGLRGEEGLSHETDLVMYLINISACRYLQTSEITINIPRRYRSQQERP